MAWLELRNFNKYIEQFELYFLYDLEQGKGVLTNIFITLSSIYKKGGVCFGLCATFLVNLGHDSKA